MDPDSLKSAARETRRRNSKRLARVVTEFEQHREQARAEREMRLLSTDLVGLAQHFGTDKWGAHRYAQHYQRHLEHLRDRPVNLLEIGVGGYSSPVKGGSSLRMWKAYLPKAQIHGLDIHDKSRLQEDRIRIFRGDQSDPDSLREVAAEIGRIDVIIDDGSHLSEHVVTTFETLFPLLAPDGIYCVEDLQTSYWPEWNGSEDLDSPATSMAMLKRVVDGLNHEEWVGDAPTPTYTDRHVVAAHFYHNLAILEKGVNQEGTRKEAILKKRYGTG